MHILLIHQAFAALDEPGGTRHHELARFLAARGHKVTVVASPVSYLTGHAKGHRVPWLTRELDGDRITILRAYTYPALHRSFAHRVVSFISFMLSSFFIGLRVRDVDLVWGTSPPIFQGATAWAIAGLKRVSFIFEVRDLWPAFAIAVGVLRQPILVRLSQWLERFLYRRADTVVVNSPGFMDHVQARGARHVALIPNGSDVDMFDPQATGERFRKANGLSDHFVVLYAGAHGLSNDLGVILEAANLLRDHREIAIVMLGDGKEKNALMARAAQMALPNLHFLPPVPKTEMPRALAAADACIAILKPIPLYATVYPNKVFDYMAAGRPVILAIDGVIREVIEQAAAGIFVPPGDPQALADGIRNFNADRHLSRVMGLNGRRYLEAHFDRATLADQLAELVEGFGLRAKG
jgi:glycosyltransferase involved in cell wall biosynthesis